MFYMIFITLEKFPFFLPKVPHSRKTANVSGISPKIKNKLFFSDLAKQKKCFLTNIN